MSFYYVDPDGNSLELQYDVFGDWAESTAFVRAATEFAANPIGIEVDPDKLLAASEAGASPEDIHRRAYSGEFPPDAPFDLRLPVAATCGVGLLGPHPR
jgi:catechol 2,3-dioxygenase